MRKNFLLSFFVLFCSFFSLLYSQNNSPLLRNTSDNPDYQIKETLIESMGADCVPYRKLIYSYNETGRLTEHLLQLYSEGGWQDTMVYTWEYDDSLLVADTEQYFDGSNWIYHYREENIYDDSGNLLVYTFQIGDGLGLVNFRQNTYYRNSLTHSLDSMYDNIWEDDAWVNDYKSINIKNSAGKDSIILGYYWSGSEWIKSGQTLYDYDDQGRLIIYTLQNWSDTEWVNNFRYFYHFDIVNDLGYTRQLWNGSEWVNQWRELKAYNPQNMIIEESEQFWNGSDWEGQERFLYSYDENNNNTSRIHQVFNSGIWNDVDQSLIDYNTDQLAVSEVYRTFDGSVWKDSLRHTHTYEPAVSVEDGVTAADDFKLYDNYPNPFNPSTKIKFRIPVSGFVILTVYDILGKEAAVIVNEGLPGGNYEVIFDAGGLPSGVYFYQLKSGSFSETRKMILLK